MPPPKKFTEEERLSRTRTRLRKEYPEWEEPAPAPAVYDQKVEADRIRRAEKARKEREEKEAQHLLSISAYVIKPLQLPPSEKN
jgi:hypothetical protein